MGSRRRAATPYRHRSSAFAWFALCLMILIALGAVFYQFVLKFDFASYTPGDQPARDFLPEGGYSPVSYPPLPYAPDETPLPTLRPTPRPTPIPLEDYALINKRMSIPDGYETVYAQLVECRASEADERRTLILRGWGYLEGLDAARSQVYVVVSTKYGDVHRFYLARRESGSSRVLHDPATGSNLDQADFSCNIRIEDTYQDGEYRLGVVVVYRNGTEQTSSYTRLHPDHNFSVDNGQIIAFEGQG